MQLRSGKITCTSQSNYSEPRENINMSLQETNTNHTQPVSRSLNRSSRNAFFETSSSDIKFNSWLIKRISLLAEAVRNVQYIRNEDKHIDNERRITCIMDKTRLVNELVAVIDEHIDYILSTQPHRNMIPYLLLGFQRLIKEITDKLFSERLFTDRERNFLGNVRANIVRLSLYIDNRITVSHIIQ
jgi:type III secretory pathway component EscV